MIILPTVYCFPITDNHKHCGALNYPVAQCSNMFAMNYWLARSVAHITKSHFLPVDWHSLLVPQLTRGFCVTSTMASYFIYAILRLTT